MEKNFKIRNRKQITESSNFIVELIAFAHLS